MWHHGTPLRSSPKSWVRLCKLAKHSNKTIAKKRKRATHLRKQQELDSRPSTLPPLSQWKHRTNTQPTSTQSSSRASVHEEEHTHTSHTSHTENTRKRHRSHSDTMPNTTREQEQGASGAPSPSARPSRKRSAPSQTATQGLVASGASSLTTGKRRRTQPRSRAGSPPPHTDHSRNLISQHSNTTQEMEARGATSLMDGPSGHKNPRHIQSRQCVYEGGTRGALTSTHLTTPLAASRPTPTPHNGRPGSWRGGRRHRLGGKGGKSKVGRGGGGNRSRARREQEVKEAGQAGRASARLTTYSTSSPVDHHPQRAAVPVGQGILRASSRLGNPSEFPMFPPGRPPDQELPPVTESVLEEGTPARVVQPINQIL